VKVGISLKERRALYHGREGIGTALELEI